MACSRLSARSLQNSGPLPSTTWPKTTASGFFRVAKAAKDAVLGNRIRGEPAENLERERAENLERSIEHGARALQV